MQLIAIRGAARAARNGREEIALATRELLSEMLIRNGLEPSDVVSAFFTMTPDLNAAFPAATARGLGWNGVPMLGAQETPVPGAPDRMIRVLLHARGRPPSRHVYLGEAAALRPDLGAGHSAAGAARGRAGHRPDPGSGPDAPPPAAGAQHGAGTLLIVGLGLIGGSLGMAVRRSGAFRRVLGVDVHLDVAGQAFRRGAADETGTEPGPFLPRADVVLLAVPPLEGVTWLRTCGERLRPGQAVVDVCSTKQRIVAEMGRLPPGVEAIGAHPMGGSERSGIEAARPDLLRGATWALVRSPRTGPRAEAAAHALVEASGGLAIGLDAERHDGAVAATSHLPYLVSVALALHTAEHEPELHRSLAGPALREMTRVAGSRPALMAEILRTNWPNVRSEARTFLRRMEGVLAELERTLPGDPVPLLESGARARETLLRPATASGP